MEHPPHHKMHLRANPPTAKERNAVQRAVNGLLDALAPERPTTRADRAPVAIERHRTPSGCVLQSATTALSASWFADADTDTGLGELQIAVWHGTLSRRGAAPSPDGASVTKELVLRPIEQPSDSAVWRASDGTTYDVDGLAAHCLALLEEQMGVDDPTGAAQSTRPRRRD